MCTYTVLNWGFNQLEKIDGVFHDLSERSQKARVVIKKKHKKYNESLEISRRRCIAYSTRCCTCSFFGTY